LDCFPETDGRMDERRARPFFFSDMENIYFLPVVIIQEGM
jgi:hypothetical protein